MKKIVIDKDYTSSPVWEYQDNGIHRSKSLEDYKFNKLSLNILNAYDSLWEDLNCYTDENNASLEELRISVAQKIQKEHPEYDVYPKTSKDLRIVKRCTETNSWTKYVNYCISTLPEMFASDTYETSERLVAHNAFIVLGNGLKWTELPSGEYILNDNDINYDLVRYSPQIFIGNVWWTNFDNMSRSFSKPFSDLKNIRMFDSTSTMKDDPYPNFHSQFCILHNAKFDTSLIESSWKNAMIEHYEYYVEYYQKRCTEYDNASFMSNKNIDKLNVIQYLNDCIALLK